MANLLPTVDFSGTVLLVYDILMDGNNNNNNNNNVLMPTGFVLLCQKNNNDKFNAGVGKETDFSIRRNGFFFANLYSIPTVLIRYFCHLESACLKTLRLPYFVDIFRPAFKF